MIHPILLGPDCQLREVNRLPEAIEIFKLGLAVHPESDSLYYGLALAYTRSGAKAQAIENVQRCLELNPEHPEAIKLLRGDFTHLLKD